MKEPPAKQAHQPKTFGPVSDLERHLPREWWRTLFNAVYLKTDGDVVENQANTELDVDLFLEASGLGQEAAVLDLCCGQGRHSIELARRGYSAVTGVDRSRYLVRLARRRADKNGLKIAFKEGDARKLRLPEASFDAVAMFGNSFGYFEREEDDLAVLRSVLRLLRSEGKIYLDLSDGSWMRTHFEPRSWEWIDQNHFVCRERALAQDGKRLIAREVVTHAERGVIADQFYAERLYALDEIQALLAAAGFTNVKAQAGPETHSDRQQDLGMMGHRLILMARAPAKSVPTPRRGPLFPKVTVLLGDPQLPDDVKLGGQFNQEDLVTVARMKQALAESSEYEFAYWNDHAGLENFLNTEHPEFVFNLCDEGYMNDPFKELHVPAMLDTRNIAYTGAGPASLGLCYNKAHVRALAQALDIPVPLESYCSPDDQAATLPSILPALLKPNFGDSSQGITKEAVVKNDTELIAYIERLRQEFPRRGILVQEFLSGTEYSVGIIGNPGLSVKVLPILEVDYSKLDPDLPKILGYESKWDPDSPYWTQISYRETTLDAETSRALIDYSLTLFERLDCKDYVRVDFRADASGKIKLLEMNPNPGWCWDGKLNFMAGFAGITYAELLRLIIEAAQERYAVANLSPGHAEATA